jgi:type VI secretion system protein VasJ
VLHKEGNHWVPDSINSQGLAFNPAFLNAINTLSHISDVAFTEGNAGMNFELRPGTADGVMQTDMIIDSQKLTYVNQLPAWKRFTWPADTEAPGANLSWISTQAGTRQYADIPGAWGWIRLLDKAAVSAYPGVGSSYSLSWKAQDGRTLNYTLRTEAGEGPLALLKLRNFRLPETIFSTTGIAPSDQAPDAASDTEDVLMSTLNALLSACQTEQEPLLVATRERVAQWDSWLQPLSGQSSAGEDPGYDDDFQQMREEVNKLSGADTELICRLAEKLLTTTAKDIRVATYYCWAKLHREGEQGLAEGLELLAGLLERFGPQLHPQRDRSRKAALEWLAGSRMTDSLSLYPEVVRIDAMRTTGALLLIAQLTENEPDETRPELNALYSALESRLQKAGGVDAVVPQNASTSETPSAASHSDAPAIGRITSGQDLLAQARTLTEYLREQPDGWLSAHHLMKSLRHDTLRAIPAPDAQGRTRIEPPRADQRALLKRLYLQQNWTEMLETADSTFSRGANHLWLDLQWYIHQALTKSGQETLADIIVADLKGLLTRLAGLETLAFSDGTPLRMK